MKEKEKNRMRMGPPYNLKNEQKMAQGKRQELKIGEKANPSFPCHLGFWEHIFQFWTCG